MGQRSWVVCVAAVAASAFVATGCGKFGTVATGGSTSTTSTTGQSQKITKVAYDDAAKQAAGCTGPTHQTDYGRLHAPNEQTTVKYKQNPPTSGEHWNTDPYKVPRPWGVYDSEQPDEAVTHNLEHGEIVVEYKGIPKSEVQTLIDARKKDPRYITIMPRDKNPKNGVYYLAWDELLYCEHASVPALQYMVDQFRDQGPEPITTDVPKDSSEQPQT